MISRDHDEHTRRHETDCDSLRRDDGSRLPNGLRPGEFERDCDCGANPVSTRIAIELKMGRYKDTAPVPMILHCPGCGARHIDVSEFATKIHHTHSCQTCGLTWRPAVGPTVGVLYLPGFKNELDVDSFEFASFHDEKAEWARNTFGPGPADARIVEHIRKELKEIEQNPSDIEEWCDVILLAMDGAVRHGHDGRAVIAQLLKKHHTNLHERTWPDWRTLPQGTVIEHIRTPEEQRAKDEERK